MLKFITEQKLLINSESINKSNTDASRIETKHLPNTQYNWITMCINVYRQSMVLD